MNLPHILNRLQSSEMTPNAVPHNLIISVIIFIFKKEEFCNYTKW